LLFFEKVVLSKTAVPSLTLLLVTIASCEEKKVAGRTQVVAGAHCELNALSSQEKHCNER
jgi:hypothetical protein